MICSQRRTITAVGQQLRRDPSRCDRRIATATTARATMSGAGSSAWLCLLLVAAAFILLSCMPAPPPPSANNPTQSPPIMGRSPFGKAARFGGGLNRNGTRGGRPGMMGRRGMLPFLQPPPPPPQSQPHRESHHVESDCDSADDSDVSSHTTPADSTTVGLVFAILSGVIAATCVCLLCYRLVHFYCHRRHRDDYRSTDTVLDT